MNGLATGFVLSQTSVVLATLTGIFFLNQKKTPKIDDYHCRVSLNTYRSICDSIY